MIREKHKTIDFANEPVGRVFRKMLLPTLVSMISIVILNLTDGAFVGHGVGSDGLAAINIAAPIFNLLAGVGIMFGIGSSVVASVLLSQGEKQRAIINVTEALVGGVAFALAMSILMLSNLAGTCRLFGSNEALLPLASNYLKWIAIFEPLIMLNMVGNFHVRLDGSPKFAMATSVVGTVLNIFLDWLLIFPLGLGVEGAAFATGISFAIAGLLVLGYMLYSAKTLHLCRLGLSIKSLWNVISDLVHQMKMGFSAMLGEIAVSGAIIAGNYVFIHYLGKDGVAAYSVACYCFPVIFMMANAIVQSAQPIVSFAYGVGNATRLREAKQLMIKLAVITGVAVSVLMWVCSRWVTIMFLNADESAYDICLQGLPFFGLGVIFLTLNIVIIGYLQSVERAMQATVFTLLRGFIIVIPTFVLLPELLGIIGMWLAIPVAEAITLLIIIITKFSVYNKQ